VEWVLTTRRRQFGPKGLLVSWPPKSGRPLTLIPLRKGMASEWSRQSGPVSGRHRHMHRGVGESTFLRIERTEHFGVVLLGHKDELPIS
jgi:hypothetical protein